MVKDFCFSQQRILCSENKQKAAPEIPVVPDGIAGALWMHHPPALVFTNTFFRGVTSALVISMKIA